MNRAWWGGSGLKVATLRNNMNKGKSNTSNLKQCCISMKNEANKIRITQIPYPQTKLCNFYQPDARSNHSTLQKMYRNDFNAPHDLPVPNLFVIKPKTREKYQKNTIRHGSKRKTIKQ